MEIPPKVISKAKNLIDQYGMRIEFVGKLNEKEVYKFNLPDNEETGFPIVYLYDKKNDTVETVSGTKSFSILSSLEK